MPLAYHQLRLNQTPPSEFSLLGSSFEPPNIRARLHAICALYAYTPVQERRQELLDGLEALTLEVAHLMALDLLENGWRPDAASPPSPSKPSPAPSRSTAFPVRSVSGPPR
ncbi:hypothetical protein [Caulobacter segnis]